MSRIFTKSAFTKSAFTKSAFTKSAFAKPAFGTFNTAMYDWGQNSNSLESYNIIPVNKWNLIMGQYTKLNLKNVCTVSNGTPPTQQCGNGYNEKPCNPCQNNCPVKINQISNNKPFYWNATIDPLGELFGNSPCGELNYTRYMV